jgi:predicted aconitase with swiveling domain
MPTGRGSSSSSSVLAEAIRLATAPAAIVLREPDSVLVIGALVALELYGRTCPIVVLVPDHHERIRTGDPLELRLGVTGQTLHRPGRPTDAVSPGRS